MNTNKCSKPRIKLYILPIIAISILTAIDQLTKFIISGSFQLYETRPLIDGVFSLTYIQNRGMAWGMLKGRRVFFMIMTLLVLLLCFYIYSNIADKKKFLLLRISLIVLISGAIGNMIDRFKLGYVIDFFDFELINFPVFNVADIYVVVSMFVIFILLMTKYDNHEFDEIVGGAHKKSKQDQNTTEPETVERDIEDRHGSN